MQPHGTPRRVPNGSNQEAPSNTHVEDKRDHMHGKRKSGEDERRKWQAPKRRQEMEETCNRVPTMGLIANGSSREGRPFHPRARYMQVPINVSIYELDFTLQPSRDTPLQIFVVRYTSNILLLESFRGLTIFWRGTSILERKCKSAFILHRTLILSVRFRN